MAKTQLQIRKGSTGTSPHALHKLENLLHVPVFLVNPELSRENSSRLEQFIANMPEDELFGILVATNSQKNLILKIWGLFYSSLLVKRLQPKLASLSGPVLCTYGIYPHIEDPFAIYQLGTSADRYANEFILPPITTGIKGLLRRLINSTTKYHISTAGIVLVLRKNK